MMQFVIFDAVKKEILIKMMKMLMVRRTERMNMVVVSGRRHTGND